MVTDLTPTELLSKVHIDILRDKTFCAFAALLACGDSVLDASIPTACTDGWNKRYNPEFLAKQRLPQARLVVLHENGHCAFEHLHVWKHLWEKDARRANLAADHFLNLALMDADAGRGFLEMPEIGVQPDPKFRGMSVAEIFEALGKEPPQEGQGRPQAGQGEPQDGDGQAGHDEHDWEGATKPSPEEQETRSEAIKQALRQGEVLTRRIGQGKGGASGMFGELLRPRVDWRAALRDFLTETCAGKEESSWRKPNRRYLSDDIYMPSLQGTQVDDLVIGFDTSGSCFGTDDATRFVTELATLIEQTSPRRVRVLYATTEVEAVQEFEDGQFAVAALKPQGGGGTDLTCIFDWIAKHRVRPNACIILTDGETPFGRQQDYPVLWAINTNRTAPWGTTLNIKEE